MTHRIEVKYKQQISDPRGKAIESRIAAELNIATGEIRLINTYTFDFDLSTEELNHVAKNLVTDAVIEEFGIDTSIATTFGSLIEKGFRPGVTDNVATTMKKVFGYAVKPLTDDQRIYTSTQYLFEKQLSEEQLKEIAHRVLGNNLIEQFAYATKDTWNASKGSGLSIPRVKGDAEVIVETFDLTEHFRYKVAGTEQGTLSRYVTSGASHCERTHEQY